MRLKFSIWDILALVAFLIAVGLTLFVLIAHPVDEIDALCGALLSLEAFVLIVSMVEST